MGAVLIDSLLVIDDDSDVLHAARLALAGFAGRIDTCNTAASLASQLDATAYDAVLLDMNFVTGDHSGREGLDHLDRIRILEPAVSVVLMTSYGGVSLAVEALKRGAFDFILKPWRNDKLVEVLGAARDRTVTARAADRQFDLERIERDGIQRALAHFEGNISRAASALGLTRPALYRRMAKHGL